MTIYTEGDLLQGQGAFEQVVRTQSSIPGRATRMSQGVAIGILSAAIRSGVPANMIDRMLNQDFADSAPLLKRVLGMYEGDD